MRKADTKEYVTQALFSLLGKKEIKDITICELVEKAGISRATFYRNYLDMYQVIDEQMTQIAREITDNVLTSGNSVRANTLLGFRLLLRHRRILRILIKRGMEDKLYRVLYQTTVDHIDQLNAMNNRYQPHFFAGAACGMLIAWIKNDFQESPDEMADLLFGCLHGYITL